MSDSKVRKWVRAFKDGQENVHDEPRSGRPSVITEDLVKAVDEKIKKKIDDHIPPTCMVEVQRWKEGSYSVLADNDFLKTNSSVEVVFFFNADNRYFEANESLSKSSEIYGPNFKYSGNLIVSVSNEMPTPVQHKLKMIKQTRILQSKIADRSKISKKAEKQIRTIVNDKIKRMMEYRDKNNSVKALAAVKYSIHSVVSVIHFL
ncbi:hypothetical protein J6590_044474 [Homalodisca vitripennis]|nr:hypothetical protein J6590_044474 [Homalodisca vitripennis]